LEATISDDRSAGAEIADLRRQLRVGEVALVDKYAARIDAVERARPWFIGGGVLGAALTGLGRFVPDTPGLVVTVAGIVLATVFGVLVGWIDFRKLELSREARNAMSIADQALERAASHAAALDDQARHRRIREDRLEAGSLMREAIASAVTGELAIGDAIDTMLDVAKLRLVAAFGFDAAEYWAVTVFTTDDAGEEMVKLAALWNDATTSALPSRGWRKGEGFTGIAWRSERAVVVPDMARPGMPDAYPVPEAKFRGHDQLRYRSAASYPIIVDGAVWGVVTATSDRPSRFDLEASDGIEASRMVQNIAGHVALLATIERAELAG
jgi:GAF domain-containing protein